MKKRIISLIICFCLISCFIPKQKASAEAITAAMVASAAYAIGQSFGMTFTNTSWNSFGTINMMEHEISLYCGSRSIAEVFGNEAMRAVAGKIVVGHVAYNAITNFLQNLATKYNLSSNRVGLGFMFADEYIDKNGNIPLSDLNGWYLDITAGTRYWSTKWYGPEGQQKTTANNDVPVSSYEPVQTIYKFYGSTGVQATVLYSDILGATLTRNHGSVPWYDIYPTAADRPTQVFGTSTGDIGSATVLNPGYGWAGQINGYEGPDTNLDQMMQQIFEDVADTNLDVDGEVITLDPPSPVETWVPVDDVIDGINQGGDVLTDIGNDVGDINDHLDDLNDIAGDAVDALEGIQTGVGDAVDALEGIQTGVNDISDTITDALDIPSAQESADYKFDLSTLFPFCIPFDIVRILRAFDGVAAAPHFQIPIVISSIGFSYTLDLDFQMFDSVATLLRQIELIAFAIALAFATSKVIRW